MYSLLVFLLVLFVLVIVHEAGHFFAAKFFKMRVEEFAFGFPPNLLSKVYKNTKYSFNLLPIGGYVKIAGENFEEKNNKKDEELFTSKPLWQQLIVVMAGIIMNILLAFFIFLFLAKSEHLEVVSDQNKNNLSNINTFVTSVLPESPAYKNNIKEKDIVNYITNSSGYKETSGNNFVEFLKKNNDSVTLNITDSKGQNKNIELSAVYGIGESDKKMYGFSISQMGFIELSLLQSISYALEQTFFVFKMTVYGIFDMIEKIINGKNVSDLVSGPVGIYKMIDYKSSIGFDVLLSFMAVISINLAVFNLLPIPALDGGRAMFIILEMIFRRKINYKYQQIFNNIGFIFLILLMLFIVYKDILKLI